MNDRLVADLRDHRAEALEELLHLYANHCASHDSHVDSHGRPVPSDAMELVDGKGARRARGAPWWHAMDGRRRDF